MRIWWCNQGQCWSCEKKAGVICCAMAENEQGETFRANTVSRVRKGDVIVHYVSSRKTSVMAISRARKNAEHRIVDLREFGVVRPKCKYGPDMGWLVSVEYFPLHPGICRDAIRKKTEKSQRHRIFRKNGWVKLGYLFPFSLAGLKIIKELHGGFWPDWAKSTAA